MFDELTLEQICTHYGEERDKNRGAVVTPIFQTSSYSLDSDYEYTRGNVPNFEVVERKLAALDHAEDAVLVDTSGETLEQSVARMKEIVYKKLAE